jgi:hypothetical protein
MTTNCKLALVMGRLTAEDAVKSLQMKESGDKRQLSSAIDENECNCFLS